MPEPASNPTGPNRRILIVDDEEFFRLSAKEALELHDPNAQIETAADGREALHKLSSADFELLLTDIKMPVMDGLELLSRLPETGFRGRIVVLSAFLDPVIETTALQRGALQLLEKPVDFEQLIAVLEDTDKVSHVEGLSLAGFVQLVEMEELSTHLFVAWEGRQGSLHFETGRLIDAQCGSLEGDDAAIEVLGWSDPPPKIDMLPHKKRQPTIESSIGFLLLESARLQDESARPTSQSLSSTGVRPPRTERDHSQRPRGNEMSTINESLDELMKVEGAIGVCLVDYESGMVLGSQGGGKAIDLDVAAAGNTAVVRSKMETMKNLKLDDKIEDILITLGAQYHLIRPLAKENSLFLYYALSREKSNLAMARFKLSSVEKELAL